METAATQREVPIGSGARLAAERTLFDVLPDAAMLVGTPERRILATNHAWHRLFGYAREEALAASTELIHVDRERFVAFAAKYEAAFAHGETATLEHPLRRRDGSIFTAQISITRVPPKPGEPSAMLGVIRDLTPQLRIAAELERSRRNLQDFVETSAIGLHWVGPDGTILWANAADHASLGYTREEYVGHDIRRFHADAHVIDDILARLGRDERLREYPARLRAKDGSIRHVLIDSSVYWENGEFIHTRCFTRDVTKQREAEARFEKVVENAPVQIVTIDASGHLLTTNRPLRGIPRDRLAEDTVYSVIVEEDRDRVRGIVERVMRTGEPTEYEAQAIVAGQRQWFHVRAAPLDRGDERGAILIAADITARKEGELELARVRAQLIQGEKLAALGSLVSGVAHELRTPLTYLSNNVFLLQRRLDEAAHRGGSAADANHAAARFLDEIGAGVDRINQLVEDLRRYTRARHQPQTTTEPLADHIIDAIDLFRATNRHSHQLETSLAPTAHVVANRGALQQLTLNLLQNAADATTAGGRIRVTTRDEGAFVVLEVSDEGTGIPDEVRVRMFEPLFTTKPTGTGLGLSIVRRIVDEHQARIHCESALGKGTTFRVEFPRAPARAG